MKDPWMEWLLEQIVREYEENGCTDYFYNLRDKNIFIEKKYRTMLSPLLPSPDC